MMCAMVARILLTIKTKKTMKNKKTNGNKIIVEIDGKEYPCYITMGAYIILEQETGKNASECVSLSDQITFLWACCKCACNREKIKFDYTLQDFADNLTPDEMAAWQAVQPKGDEEPSSKKA